MIRFIALAALAALINVTSASAQPVLSNGGFEQSPPNNYKNNINWPIAPWVLTSGSANVVTVDGPGGQTSYGSAGPHSDATGGTGNQHYLDQAYTVGAIYQEFTPLCTGEVRYGAFFSTRDNSNGTAQVSILDATGSNTISGPANISIAGGDSENDPWQLAAFTATLTAGTTYRFEIFMDDNMNMDNAYVAFGPECTEHTNPDWAGPDDELEPVQCTPFEQQEVTCNTTTGLYEVTISNSMSSMFNPTNITATTTVPGVTISTDPFDRLTLLISGAAPGDFIPISTQAIEVGAGNGPGLDLCCNGDMYVSIPEGEICEIIDDPDQDDPIGDPDAPLDVSVEKVWSDFIESQMDGNQVPHGFEILVNLDAGTLMPGDVITVVDPALSQVNVTPFGPPVAPAGWTCSVSGASWSCQYVVPNSGAVLPALITYPSIIDGSSHVLNCAGVSTVSTDGSNPDINSANNESCWEDNAPVVDEPSIEMVKTGPASCAIGAPCDFTVTFTNTDSAPYTGNVLMQDQTSVPGFDVTNVSPMPAGCGGNLPANPFACVISLNNFAAGASQTYTITMAPNAGGQVVAETGENCANVVAVPNSVTPGDYSWNIHQDGEDAMPADYAYLLLTGIPISNSCVPISTSTPNTDYAVLEVEKTCARQPSLGENVIFVCNMIVTSDGGVVVGDIDLNDFLSHSGFQGDTNAIVGQLSSSDPWTCATAPYSTSNTPECSISGADFMAAGGTSTVTSVVVVSGDDLGETDIVNCAQIVNDASEPPMSCAVISETPDQDEGNTGGDTTEPVEVNIFKECDPIVATYDLTGTELGMTCQITVQPLTSATGTITISDVATNIAGGGQAGFEVPPTGDTNVWTCAAPSGATQDCTADGATYPVDGNGTPIATVINLNLTIEYTGGEVTWENCANGTYQSTGNAPAEQLIGYCAQQTFTPVACNPIPEIPYDMIDNDCDGLVDENMNSREGSQYSAGLTLEKSSLGACSINEQAQTYSCDFAFVLNNNDSTAFNGLLNINDVFGSPTPRNFVIDGSDDWTCLSDENGTQANCVSPEVSVPVGESTTVEMSLTIPGLANGGTFENCAAIATPTGSVVRNQIVQLMLNDLGIDVGTVDGVVGPNTRAGIVQLERQENWPETGEVSPALLRALGLSEDVGEQSCVTVQLPNMPEPPLVCDPATTVLLDGACECRFSRMLQSSASSCSCVQGTQLDAGRGCFRPERQVSEPRRQSTPSTSTPSTPSCPAGSTYNAARGECLAPASRPSCGDPNQVMVNGRCRCTRGYVLRSGSCREERRDTGGGGGSGDLP